MMPHAAMEPVGAFLEEPNRGVLVTLGPSGDPHVVVVDFLLLDGAVLLNGRQDRRWVRNLRRDPRATLLVHDATAVEHWVRLTGPVELLGEGDDASVEDAKRMSRRYGDDPDQFDGQHRVSWRLVPSSVVERTG